MKIDPSRLLEGFLEFRGVVDQKAFFQDEKSIKKKELFFAEKNQCSSTASTTWQVCSSSCISWGVCRSIELLALDPYHRNSALLGWSRSRSTSYGPDSRTEFKKYYNVPTLLYIQWFFSFGLVRVILKRVFTNETLNLTFIVELLWKMDRFET